MEKKSNNNILKNIEKYGILDELAYNTGGYVIEPTNSKIDMANVRALRKLSKNKKYRFNLKVKENAVFKG